MMGFIWFWLVAVMIVGYVVLDGFDLGVGVLHLFLVRQRERTPLDARQHRPVWTAMKCGCWPAAARSTSLPAALRLGLQRLLSAADDRALAADFARREP